MRLVLSMVCMYNVLSSHEPFTYMRGFDKGSHTQMAPTLNDYSLPWVTIENFNMYIYFKSNYLEKHHYCIWQTQK